MNKNTEWTNATRYIVGVGLALFGLYAIYLSRAVITLLIVASLIAFLLMPVVGFFQARLKIRRSFAVLLSYLLLILLILLLPLIFVPKIIDGFSFLSQVDYPILVDNALQWSKNILLSLKNLELLGFTLNLDIVIDPALNLIQNTEKNVTPTLPSTESIINSLQSAASLTFGLATNVAGTVFSGVVTFALTLFSAIYISIDAPKFGRTFLNIVPPLHRQEMAMLFSRLRNIWQAYFRGQLNLMFIIGIVTWIGAIAIGLPGAFPLAVIAGLMELIPGLGPLLAAVPAVVVALVQGSTYLGVNHFIFALIVIGLYVAIQQIENSFVVPRVLGEAMDLHALVVMLGVVVGANVGGILGALLAAPVIASLKEIVRYLYAKILGELPFPPELIGLEEEHPSWLDWVNMLTSEAVSDEPPPSPAEDK